MTARERYSRTGSRPAHEVSSRPSPETCRGPRRPLTLACALACAAALSIPLALTSHAQTAQRGPIQTPGGGRGPGAAPDANDPANANADLSPKPPVLPLSPEEEAKRLWLPPGYRMEPVLSDPLIEDPAQIAFDGNGRMFVVELRGYFQTPEGIDLIPPIGRISMHEDRDNDGVFERHSVFVDKLVFPRFVLPFGANTILTMETNADEVWKYTDTNGDGVADKKELFATNFGRAGNMESQQASLFWAMDNWLYSTVNAFRLRWTPNGILKEPTGPNSSQWGVTQDNDGKVWFQGGASGVPGYFQFPVHYGNFAPPDQFEPDLNIVWGAPIRIGDIQAGLPGTRMPDGSLIYATAAAGNEIYRGDRLPKDLAGDYLHGEVVARIVRRLRPVKTEGLTQLQNVYPRSEFIRSLDPLFRPADVTTGPDGTIYIADMYRGMIEGAEWAKQGTYLREKINQYQLDKVVGHGRVWRLTYDGIARDRTRPRMLEETPAQLVAHLSHPNGWWRDTAQQLLVLKQDKSVVPALQTLVRTSKNLLARFHALWTLEGLGALDAAADARAPARCGSAHANPGAARQRDALQGRRPVVRCRLSQPVERHGRRRRHSGDVDDARAEGGGCLESREGGGREQQGARRAVRRRQDRDIERGRRTGRRTRRRSDRRTAEQPRARQRHLHGVVLRVPRRRRTRHADAGRGGRRHAGAFACRIATRQRASRLRHQVRAARTFRSARWQDLSAGHGRDGHEQRPVDRRRRFVRAQQFRKHRRSGDTCRRREGAGRDGDEIAVDRRGARGFASTRARPRCVLESHGQPRWATQRRRPTPKAATTTWATPPAHSASWAGRPACHSSRACGSRSSCRRQPR